MYIRRPRHFLNNAFVCLIHDLCPERQGVTLSFYILFLVRFPRGIYTLKKEETIKLCTTLPMPLKKL